MNLSADERIQKVREFDDKVSALLVEYQDVFGPIVCDDHGPQICECNELCSPTSVPSMLKTWVICFGWETFGKDGITDMGESVHDYYPNRGSMIWDTVGLIELTKNQLI